MHRQDVLKRLTRQGPVIAPSMLKCDFGRLAAEIDALTSAGAMVMHWDVMDGHFVPNLTYGAPVIAAVREQTGVLFDAHLMIAEPERYLDDFLAAGCDIVTIHYEAVADAGALLSKIREADRLAGLAINPGTPVEALTGMLPECDLVLVMSVEPGFGGQSFQPGALLKLRELKSLVSAGTILAVDGGIGPETIGPCAEAGANLFVVGSAIFDRPDYQAALDDLTAKIQAAA